MGRTRGHCGRTYLDSRYTYADMGGLDHAHVIRAVANCQKDRLLILLDEFDDKSFLQWRHTTYEQCDLATCTRHFMKDTHSK